MVELKNLSFSYGNQTIFQNYNFQLDADQIVGVIGVNGSGKSTFMKLILGLIKPQQGEALAFQRPGGSTANKPLIGSTLQEIDFPNTEKVFEILDFIRDQYLDPLPSQMLIDAFDLNDFKNKSCGQLSGGMKRRLALACAFSGKPQLVLLDEPTTGLDQSSRQRMMDFIKSYRKEHKALVMMISHHPEEIMEQVDQYLHIKNGKIHSLTPEKMKNLTKLRRVKFHSPQQPPKAIKTSSIEHIHSVICEDSDSYVRELINSNQPFSDLRISQLGADELMEEIL